jgi:hypothetical protein
MQHAVPRLQGVKQGGDGTKQPLLATKGASSCHPGSVGPEGACTRFPTPILPSTTSATPPILTAFIY